MENAPSTVAIIGTGLIGTSVGLALKKAAPQNRIVGFDLSRPAARQALRRGALDAVADSVEQAVARADITVVAVPIGSVIATLPRVFRSVRKGSLVMDVAGLKSAIIRAVTPLIDTYRGVAFAAGHPFAGSHQAGPIAARGDLFFKRPFALCVPEQPGRQRVVRRAQSFVRSIGARPQLMAAGDHDRIVATTSGLPQLVASAVALAVADAVGNGPNLTGPGFDSVTRLATSPASLWIDGFVANRRNIVAALDVFKARLRSFYKAIEAGDRTRLRRLLRSGAAAQQRLRSR